MPTRDQKVIKIEISLFSEASDSEGVVRDNRLLNDPNESIEALFKRQWEEVTHRWCRSDAALANFMSIPYFLANCLSTSSAKWRCVKPFFAAGRNCHRIGSGSSALVPEPKLLLHERGNNVEWLWCPKTKLTWWSTAAHEHRLRKRSENPDAWQ